MLIYANPSTVPARRRTKKKGLAVAKRRKRTSTNRRRVTRRRVTKNPTFRARRRRAAAPAARRRVHRNPSRRGGGMFKGILGELSSMNGVILIGSAVAAPTVTDFAVKHLPENLKTGYAGLVSKAVVVAAGAWVLDRFAKSRHAALGFAIGGLGKVVSDTINVIQVRRALPSTVAPAAADEIAANPSAFRALMDGQFNSLNGYSVAPSVAGYDAVMAESFESLN